MVTFLHKIWLTAFVLIFADLSAQRTQEVEKLRQDYFDFFNLNRETLFLHLNKTSIVPDEDLWFSAYVYNTKTELPNPETANLNIKIYTKDGVHIDSRVFYISGGKGSGFLELEADKFPPGDYLMEASTNYMKNFEENLPYIQGFTVLGKDPGENPRLAATQPGQYDLQLLPEGGHLVTGTMNSIGVKLLNEKGLGIEFNNAKVMDTEGLVITRFSSNKFGMSRFFFTPESDQEYRVVLETVSGQEIHQQIAPAEKAGMTIVSSEKDDEFIVSVRTNEATRELLNNKDFLFAIHKDGKLKDFRFKFPDDKLEVLVSLNKDSLFPGVNTITIFDPQLQPVVERMIFNMKNLKRSRILAEVGSENTDSLRIDLQATSNLAPGSLSISVLPSETQAHNPDHNILSAFHLKPFINGYLEGAGHYFNPENGSRTRYDMDLLLLSQGWSKYDWTSSFLKIPKEDYDHHIGFEVKGKVNNYKEGKRENLFLGSDDTGFFEVLELEPDGSFGIDRVFLLDSTNISFGLLNTRNQKVTKPSLVATVYPTKELQNKPLLPPHISTKELRIATILPNVYSFGGEVLDTVMITTETIRDPVFTPDLQTHARGFEITEELANRFHYITDFIATKGFEVRTIEGRIQIRSRFSSSIPGNSSNAEKGGRVASSNVMLYLNGSPLDTNASFLNGLLSSEVESIVINKLGYGYGGNGVNGVIKIKTKQGGYIPDTSVTVQEILTNNGYTANREFYAPRYKVYGDSSFNYYGVIDWKPSVTLNEEGRTEIQIPKLKPSTLYVQGMAADGTLVWEELKIEAEDDQKTKR